MAQELIYTSTPRGLRLGSSGFCTVACTRGMAANYVETLESLSGYATVFPPNHPRAADNPVALSHYRLVIGGKPVNVLSRVSAGGVDYTGRPNKVAHHLVLEVQERALGGPAWVMRQPGVLLDRWEGAPRFLDQPRRIPSGTSPAAPCREWQQQIEDAGWAGVLAQAFLDTPERPAFIIFKPGTSMLPLMDEALRLLPAERRWDVTFNTYFTSLPRPTNCAWRCCLQGSPALKQARRMRGALVLDLEGGRRQPPVAVRMMQEGSPLVDFARTGIPPPVPAPVGSSAPRSEGKEKPESAADAAQAEQASRPVRAQPRSPAEVWLDSSHREPAGEGESRSRVALYVVIALLIFSLAMNAYFLMTRSGGAVIEEDADTSHEVVPDGVGVSSQNAENVSEDTDVSGQETETALNGNGEDEDAGTSASPIEPPETQADAPPFLIVARIPEGGGLADEISDPSYSVMSYSIRDLPIGAGWRLDRVAHWPDDPDPATSKAEEERDGNGIVFRGPYAGGIGKMVLVRIEPVEGAVCITPEPTMTKTQQKDVLNYLKDAAWLELSKGEADRLIVLTKQIRGEIHLKRFDVDIKGKKHGQPPEGDRYEGYAAVPAFLEEAGKSKECAWRWEPRKGIAGDWQDPVFVPGPRLKCSVKVAHDVPLPARTLEFHCDGQVIAAFDVIVR